MIPVQADGAAIPVAPKENHHADEECTDDVINIQGYPLMETTADFEAKPWKQVK